MYQPRRHAVSRSIPVRDTHYHALVWGEAQADEPPLVMLHGWMDVGASFQFVVDAMSHDRQIIAPDWRGFGLTPGVRDDHHFYIDYLGDLDVMLDEIAGDRPVDLVGHSMGGNLVMLYAGVRPGRVRRVVNLEGFGLPASDPDEAPGRYGQWLDQMRQLRRGELDLKSYDDEAGVARRLMRTNPRLAPDKAAWLAQHWAQPGADGRWRILAAPAHKVVSAHLFRADETVSTYRRIEAPVLAVEAASDSISQIWPGRFSLAEYHERLAHVPNHRTAVVANAGHMLHHDQPEEVARLVQDFLDRP